MIHHISISARNPERVAQALAEVMKALVAPFPPHPGSYFVLPQDNYGTGIEVYPIGSELLPGEGNSSCQFAINDNTSQYTATHAAISVPTSTEEIEQIAEREGWRAVRCNRDGIFDVMEFWVENRLMIEFLTPEMASQYLAFITNPEMIKSFMQAPALA